jgi:hypothetical protein
MLVILKAQVPIQLFLTLRAASTSPTPQFLCVLVRKSQKQKVGLPSALFEGPRSNLVGKPGTGARYRRPPRRAANLHRKRAQVVSHLNLTKIRRATFGCCVVEIVFD